MDETSDTKGNRPTTRSTTRRAGQAASAACDAEAASSKPQTSGELKYRPMRLWQRRQPSRRGHEGTDPKRDCNEFMDHSPPGALYPYAARVHAAIKTVFQDNLHLFKGLGATGASMEGEDLDCFGEVIDEPVLEELFCQEEGFFLSMAAPEEAKNGEASSKD
ncbi:uncharacterized protein PG986_002680 [Apiospora aurea]|uniref:Uncharacterized protein n=1 Tax=Apiospora aurea TaxID=335848 RepID=A0ABR1QPQ5_9PEZI